ncbi:hypothetical protein PM082_019953 [Marasmius tenuissimus]|nr:hypothetical protein PM082_019953 [Marasmius tenuissimus]
MMLRSRSSHIGHSSRPCTLLFYTLPPRTKRQCAPYPSRAHVSDSEDDCGSKGQRKARIPKPQGEVGRLGRGGYNLQRSLGWSKAKFDLVKGFVRQRVKKELDCSVIYRKQPAHKVDIIRRATLENYPWLINYEDLWVIDVIPQMAMDCQTVESRAERPHPKLASTSSQRDRKRSPSIIYIPDSSSDSHELASNDQNSSTNTSRYDTVYISDSDEETRSGGAVQSSQPDNDTEEERAVERMLQSERGNGVDGSDDVVQDDELFSDSESEGMDSDADKIPKPAGEVGRPRSGGYNLEKALNWRPERYSEATGFT